MTAQEVENATKAVRCVTDFVNAYGHSNEKFAEALSYEHRTLQQQTFNLMLTCIDMWANQDNYDLRNEHTILTCKRIRDSFGDDWKYMKGPLI